MKKYKFRIKYNPSKSTGEIIMFIEAITKEKAEEKLRQILGRGKFKNSEIEEIEN